MRVRSLAAILAAGLMVLYTSPLFAQDAYLSRPEKRAYHACLYAQWITNYCRVFAWRIYGHTFSDCIIANGGCQCAITNDGYWGPEVDDACRAVYRGRRP